MANDNTNDVYYSYSVKIAAPFIIHILFMMGSVDKMNIANRISNINGLHKLNNIGSIVMLTMPARTLQLLSMLLLILCNWYRSWHISLYYQCHEFY